MSGTATAKRIHVTALIEVGVFDREGASLGKIADIMLDAETGAIAYVALAVGGLLGVGEKLFAIPWSCFRVNPESQTVSVEFSAQELDSLQDFDKDAWPSNAASPLADRTSAIEAENARTEGFTAGTAR
jgi:sporulation protein YlmC with PRC-barrel domain